MFKIGQKIYFYEKNIIKFGLITQINKNSYQVHKVKHTIVDHTHDEYERVCYSSGCPYEYSTATNLYYEPKWNIKEEIITIPKKKVFECITEFKTGKYLFRVW